MRQALDLHEDSVGQFVSHDDGRDDGETAMLARDQTQHRHVIDFRGDPWPNLQALCQRIEASANIALHRRQNEILLTQQLFETSIAACEIGRSDQTHGLTSNRVRRPRRGHIPGRRRRCEDDVQLVRFEHEEKISHQSRTDHDLDVIPA